MMSRARDQQHGGQQSTRVQGRLPGRAAAVLVGATPADSVPQRPERGSTLHPVLGSGAP